MPASQLPITGTCYYCGEPCKWRFCNHSCNDKYNMQKRRGIHKAAAENAAKSKPKEEKWTAVKVDWKVVAARIESIGQRNDERQIDQTQNAMYSYTAPGGNGIHGRRAA